MEWVVYFAHGQESGSWGSKIRLLADHAKAQGLGVESPDYSDSLDGEPRLARLQSLLEKEERAYILVGSSMGGWVSCRAAEQFPPKGLFLMAPAFEMPGHSAARLPSQTPAWMIHGWEDDIVPAAQSQSRARPGLDRLLLVPDGHRLADSHDVLGHFFHAFLNHVTAE